MKKLLSLILALLMIFACTSVAFAAEEKYPVIYIPGYGSDLYAEKGNKNSELIYPTGADVGAIVKEAIAPCLKELALAIATGDYDKYCDELYNAVHPIYEDLVLAPDGMPKDNSGRGDNPNSVWLDYSRFSHGETYFAYDWRLSPEYCAEQLVDRINIVLKKTGAKKVSIVARCFAGNILSAYLQNHSDHAKAKVNDAVLFIPSTEGINLIGALFAGKIDIVAENLDTYAESFLKYEAVIEDTAVRDLVVVMVSILEQAKALNLGTDALQKLIDEIKDNLIPRLVRRTYGSFPSFWSMVPTEYLEDAIAFVYNTPELQEEYKGTIDKARSYNSNVMLNARSCIKELNGDIDISVISKYNLPLMPVFADCKPTSDGIAETEYTSFGATVADFGKTLSADYIASISEVNKKFLSPDNMIDASTCALPEKTWFIKNSYHDHFPASIDKLIEAILTTDIDVFSNELYPQFLDAAVTAETIVPIEKSETEVTPDDGNDETNKTEKENWFDILRRFIDSIINFFKGLFTK
ncbi:MAG: hypothetical protein IIX98_02115 [Clostridia bacterium]|nr:hypothetical protein [Clostridia bacterium]